MLTLVARALEQSGDKKKTPTEQKLPQMVHTNFDVILTKSNEISVRFSAYHANIILLS